MSDINKLEQNFDILLTELDSVKETYRQKALELLHELVQEYLNTAPKAVVGLQWTQYTPYFNDGDACEFGVYFESYDYENLLFKFNEEDEIEDWYGIDDSLITPELEAELDACSPLLIKISNFMHQNTSMLKDVIGNNVKVRILRGSKIATIEEYSSHD